MSEEGNRNNPWEDAEGGNEASWAVVPPPPAPRQENGSSSNEDENEELLTWIIRRWIYAFHGMDVVLGLTLILGLSVVWSFLPNFVKPRILQHVPNWLIKALGCSLGGIWLLRGMYTLFAFFHWTRKRNDALRCSGIWSLVLGGIFLCGGLFFLLFVDLFRHHEQSKWFWIPLFGWTGLEWLRFLCVDAYRKAITIPEAEESPDASPEQASVSRPWWWQRSHGNADHMQEPLLHHQPAWAGNGNRQPYEMQEGLDQGVNRGGLLRRIFRNGPSQNVRDDGSVDFASVQEDWANKSQEDPLWWSREETERTSNLKAEAAAATGNTSSV